LPPSDELSFSFCVSSPVLSRCCPWHPVWCIFSFSLLFFLFSCLVHGRASPTLPALTHRQQFLPYRAAPWSNYGTPTTWWRGSVAGVASGSFLSPTVPPPLTNKKGKSPSEYAQDCGRGLASISDEPIRSLQSTLMAPPWAAPRARAAIDSGGGASFRSLSAPRAGRIAHLATRKPDQDGSPAAIGRFCRATDENGCADRLDNAALLWSLRQKLDRPRQANRRLGQSNTQTRLLDRPGLSTFLRNDNTTAVQADDNEVLACRQRSHPIRRTSIPVTHSIELCILHVVMYNVMKQTSITRICCGPHLSY